MATGTTSNARRLDRIPTNISVTLLFEFQGQPQRQRARLFDISDTGMRLKTGVELVKGQEAEIISQHGMQDAERIRVVWVSAAESEPAYWVGVEFLNPHLVNPSAMPSEMVSRQPKDVASNHGPESDTRKVVGDDRGPMAKN
jgi:PilZ domain